MTTAPSTLVLVDQSLAGGPAEDVALGPLLLAQGLGAAGEIVRIFRPQPTAAFSRRDSRRPGFDGAAEVVRTLGFTPVIRPQGGQLAAYHRGSIVIDHVVRATNPTEGLKSRFEEFAKLHAEVLRAFGLDARIGELPGEYCPGSHSINIAGLTKVVGSAQRITRDGWLFSTIVQVEGADSIRAALTAAYDEIGYDLDPSTIGSAEDHLPGLTAPKVEDALVEAYSAGEWTTRGELPTEVLEQVAELSRPNPY